MGVTAVFLAGCAVGGTTARFVVPSASAQQAAILTKWEYTCFEVSDELPNEVQAKSNAAGAQGWEMSGVYNQSGSYRTMWCFKRAKM
jgi:hypothetical protein